MATRNNRANGTTARRIISAAWLVVLFALWPAPGAELVPELDGVSRAAAVTRRERSF